MSEPIRIGPPDEEIYGPSPREEQPWQRYRKYVGVVATDERDLCDHYTIHQVWLKVDHQSFRVNDGINMSCEQAEWMREQLCKALARLVEAER